MTMPPSIRQRRTTMPNTPLAKLHGESGANEETFDAQPEEEASGVSQKLPPELLAEILAKTALNTA